MSIRFIGPIVQMGPVLRKSDATLVRGRLVRVASGETVAMTDAATTGFAVALDSNPDSEYEGTKTMVQLARLGENQEVEIRFSGAALTQAMIGGGPYNILAANGGTVNVAATAQGVFRPLRVGRDTKLGDTSGYLIGVFTDTASL
jgi:hypothetical protein